MPPRGGRGGGRRGGGVKPGTTRIGGMEIAMDPDIGPDKSGRPQPSKTFPDYPGGEGPPSPRAPTVDEQSEIAFQKQVRTMIRGSPLYTTISDSTDPSGPILYSSRFGPGATMPRIVGQKAAGSKRPHLSGAAAIVDPFNVMPHYSDRYDQKRRRMPALDQQKVRVVLDFFPEELHGVLDSKLAKKPSITNGRLKKERDNLDANEIEAAEADEAEAANASYDEEDEAKSKSKNRKTKVVAEEGEDIDERDEDAVDDAQGAEDAEVDEQDEDDDFEEDEEDDAGDYNAEGYFDDGGEDAGDDGMADGDGGGDYD